MSSRPESLNAEERTPSRIAGLASVVEWPLIALCAVVGSVLRFAPASPMWLDEALTVNIAAAPLAEIGGLLRRDGHPPLYYFVLHGWIEIFGTGAGAVRALSGIVGLGLLAMVAVVGRRHGGPRLAGFTVAIVAVSPFAVRYSSEARMYELVSLLALVGWWLLDRALDPARSRRGVLAGLWLVSGALLLTHYWAMFLLAATGLGILWSAWRAPTPAQRRRSLEAAVAIAAGGVWFVPWVSAFAYQAAHTGTPWAKASRPTRVVSESFVDWAGGTGPEAVLLIAALAALLAMGLFGRVHEGRLELGPVGDGWRRRALWIIGATFAIGAAASTLSAAAYAGRYSSVIYPFAMLLVGAGLAGLPTPFVRVSALAVIAMLSLASIGLALKSDRTQAGEVGAELRRSARPGDLVVVCPDQLGPAIQRLAPTDVRVVRTPDLGDPRFVDWVDYADRQAASSVSVVADRILATAGTGTIWLVWSGSYRLAGPQCDELAGRLSAIRPGTSPEVQADPAKYFESASLIRLVAR
ncbi:MAG: hypothetical protein F2754_02225 [Actinobacteria bacterium]|uniref:Unannotated protein n=1 Tax=freshwater metagenome TaxID=449393 RepID=A0A6J6Z8V0_9ZZZZ|nr:hypothetical protein [Actinomycetota bacterium]MSY71024.1 hypothetical protein [Actinomycetota bacterium]